MKTKLENLDLKKLEEVGGDLAMTSKMTEAIEVIRYYQKTLSDNQRISLWGEIQAGYCPKCGDKNVPCFCAACYDE